ncbi:MAG: 2-oxoglutarate oxidoreductase [Mogibacterium sp.]|nr:2-oxoglutarate oxidoreductase [Mogibacterium sp.]
MEQKIYGLPEGMNDKKTSFCPGCSHMAAYRTIVESLNELNERDNAVIVRPIGCSLNADYSFDIHAIQSMHGRASAVATGVARMHPEKTVLAYQGDGDAHSIGIAECLYAANRGEKMTCIVINNSVYGMTGGQMSGTTLLGQRTTTGIREFDNQGAPIHVAEMIAQLEAPGYVARAALYTPKDIMQAKKFMVKALRCQKELGKYSYIELLSFCPTNWGVKPVDCIKYAQENVLPVYPVGELKTCF